MEDLIRQAFLHVEVIGPHVADGHYDLVGPNGEIILPQVWETMIEPDWVITMHMWPMPEPPPPPPAPPEGAADPPVVEVPQTEAPVPPPPPTLPGASTGKSESYGHKPTLETSSLMFLQLLRRRRNLKASSPGQLENLRIRSL